MEVNYVIGTSCSLTGQGYYNLSFGAEDNPNEALQAILDLPSRFPPTVVVNPEGDPRDFRDNLVELVRVIREQFKCRLVLRTIDSPCSVWDLFDWVILLESYEEWIQYPIPANEVWLDLFPRNLHDKTNLPKSITSSTMIWVYPKNIERADVLAWLMVQHAPIRIG